MPTIRLENVTKWYLPKGEKRRSGGMEIGIADVDLTIQQGEFVFVVGSSGAGKSTLLGLLSGAIKPDRGRVLINDKDISKMLLLSHNKAKLLFGHVMQESSLIRKKTVEENLQLAARIGSHRFESKSQVQARVEKVLGLVCMSNSKKKYPAELSSGQCRRIELARALINSPAVLVIDELTANLDDDTIWDMFHLLQEVNRKGTTVIMATHASKYVNIIRRRVVTLVDGRVFGDVQKGKYGDVI